MTTPTTDDEVLRAAAAGDEAAAAALVARHWADAVRLARRLTGDAAAADDVAQEALVQALRAGRRFEPGRPVGPWLRAIVRNQARKHHRGGARRARREVAAARPERVETTPAIEAHDEVEACLASLPEPQRAAVVLHHLEGLTIDEVGQVLGWPRGTVSSRLRRGIEALQARQPAHGLGPAALLAQLARATSDTTTTPPRAAVLVARAQSLGPVTSWLVAGLAAAALVTAVAVAPLVAPATPPAAPVAAAPAEAPAVLQEPAPAPNVVDERAERGGAPAAQTPTRGAAPSATLPSDPGPVPAAMPGPAADGVVVRGRVVDPDGRAVRDAWVLVETEDGAPLGEARTDLGGRFEVRVPRLWPTDGVRVEGRDERGVAVETSWPIGPNRDLLEPAEGSFDLGEVQVDRWRELVVDVRAEGRPVAGAEVRFAQFAIRGEPADDVRRTDAAGRVSYGFHGEGDDAYGVPLSVRCDGFAVEPRDATLPPEGAHLVVELVREVVVTGHVLDPTGRPLPGARLEARPRRDWLSGHPMLVVVTDETGRFALHGLGDGREYAVSIAPPAGAPLVAAERELVVRRGEPLDVTLQAAGAVLVRVEAPITRDTPREELAAWTRALGPGRGAFWLERQDPASGEWEPLFGEPSLLDSDADDPGRLNLRFANVPEGTVRVAFTGLPGLAPDHSASAVVVPGEVARCELRLVKARTIRARVVDEAGRPIGGATVARSLGGGTSSRGRTNSDGRVELAAHPAREVVVSVEKDGFEPREVVIPIGVDDPPSIVLRRR